ncbi:MAG: hypothetical protein Kow0090_06570 [Myxococcota bacterium]
MKRLAKNEEKGFTIIELMIVIAIVAILAAIAVPNLLAWVCHSRMSEGSASIQVVGTAVRVWGARNGTFAIPAGSTWQTLNVQMQPGRRYTLCAALEGGGQLTLLSDAVPPVGGCPGGAQAPMGTVTNFRVSGNANLDGDPLIDVVYMEDALEPTHFCNGRVNSSDCMEN